MYLVKLGNGVVWKRHIDQIVAVDTGVVVDEGVVDVNNADSQLSVKSPESLEGQSVDLKTPVSPSIRKTPSPRSPQAASPGHRRDVAPRRPRHSHTAVSPSSLHTNPICHPTS